MNKPFTEIPLPPKRRLILDVRFTVGFDPYNCEGCWGPRAKGQEKPPVRCACCGKMLCRKCFGTDGYFSAEDGEHYHICDGCAEFDSVDIQGILNARKMLEGR